MTVNSAIPREAAALCPSWRPRENPAHCRLPTRTSGSPRQARTGHLTGCNQVSLESMEKFLEYNPAANIHLIAPTPLLMVVAKYDTLTPTDLAVAAYERALRAKIAGNSERTTFLGLHGAWILRSRLLLP